MGQGRWVGVTCWVNSTWLCFAPGCGKPSVSTRWAISLILGVNGIMKQPSQCLFISLCGLALPKREICNEWEWLRLWTCSERLKVAPSATWELNKRTGITVHLSPPWAEITSTMAVCLVKDLKPNLCLWVTEQLITELILHWRVTYFLCSCWLQIPLLSIASWSSTTTGYQGRTSWTELGMSLPRENTNPHTEWVGHMMYAVIYTTIHIAHTIQVGRMLIQMLPDITARWVVSSWGAQHCSRNTGTCTLLLV